jgi:hypothetical protein
MHCINYTELLLGCYTHLLSLFICFKCTLSFSFFRSSFSLLFFFSFFFFKKEKRKKGAESDAFGLG